MLSYIKFKDSKISLMNSKTSKPYKVIVFVGENGSGKTTLLRKIHKEYNNSLFLHQDIKYRQALKNAGREMGGVISGKDVNGGEIRNEEKLNNIIASIIERYFPNSTILNNYSKNQNSSALLKGIGKQVGLTQIIGGDFHIPMEAYTQLDSLSSGEQENLLRLFYLAENFTDDKDLLLLDEPETALHPKWQQQVLNIYLDCLNENQQLIVATHSENILKESMKNDDCLVIKINRINNNNLELQKVELSDRVIPYISFAEIQYLIFGIPSNDYHNELFGEIQNRFSKTTVKSCDTLLKDHSSFLNTKHYKPTTFTNPNNGSMTDYFCISTWIRNEVNHPPSSGKTFNDLDLENSIKFMRGILIPNINTSNTIIIDGTYDFDSDLDFEEYEEAIKVNQSNKSLDKINGEII